MSRKNLIYFKTLKKSNIVFLKNPSRRRLLHLSGNNKGKVKQIQPIQYTEGYDTIVLEELKKIDPSASPTPLYSKKGVFRISEDDIYLLDFIRSSEQNEENGGRVFREVNVQKEESLEIEAFEAYDKAINAVMDCTHNEARALAMEFISPTAVKYSIQKIKLNLRTKINSSDQIVEDINRFMAGKVSDEKLLVAIALKENIIEIRDGKKVRWANNGEIIFTGSQAKDINEELSAWLKNDEEGRQYLKSISDKIPTKK